MRSSTSATRVGPPCGATLSHQRRVPPNRIGGPSRGSTSDGGQHPWNLDGKAVDATLANPSGPRSRSHARPGLDLAIQGTSCHPALLFSGPSHDMARTAHAGRVRSREVGGAGGLSARTHTADMGDRAAYCETIGRQASEDLSREAARSSSQHASALPGRAQTNQGQARRRIAAGSGERRARIDQQDLRNEGGRNGDGTAR
jgi:hypothetical protein